MVWPTWRGERGEREKNKTDEWDRRLQELRIMVWLPGMRKDITYRCHNNNEGKKIQYSTWDSGVHEI